MAVISGNEPVLLVFYLLGSIFHPSPETRAIAFNVRGLFMVLSFSISSVNLTNMKNSSLEHICITLKTKVIQQFCKFIFEISTIFAIKHED